MNGKKKILIVLLNITKILLFLVFANFIINSYNPTEEQLSSAKRNKDTLNLKEKDINLIDKTRIYLENKKEQKEIIEKLYGKDLNTPEYFHLKDHIEINTKESQQNLGICSIFATIKAIETNIALTENINYNFSERYIDYMTSKSFFGNRNTGKLNTEAGDGVSYSDIITLIENHGLALEEEVPYRDYNESEYNIIRNAKGVRTIDQYIMFSNPNEENDKYYWQDILKKHITKYGGIIGSIQLYESLYNNQTNSFYNNGDESYYKEENNENINHAVVIVGWDDNYSKNNFIVPVEKDGAFIAYNPWGSKWGDNGYFYISYEDIDIFYNLWAIIRTTPYYEKTEYLNNLEIPPYEDILYEDKYPFQQGDPTIWYYAYKLPKNKDYPQINEFNFYTSFFTEISIYINPYNSDINALNNFINVGNTKTDEVDNKKYHFIEPVNIYGDEFAIIIKYQSYSYRLHYHKNIEENDNIYIYKNKKWEKATKVPYFNIYGYKM